MMFNLTLSHEEIRLVRVGLQAVPYAEAKPMLELLSEDEGEDIPKFEFSPEQMNLIGKALGEVPLKYSFDLFVRLKSEAINQSKDEVNSEKELIDSA